MPVPDAFEHGEDPPPGPAHQQRGLGLLEGDDPGVPLHGGGGLLVLEGDGLFGQQVEALELDLGGEVGVGPGRGHAGPVGGRPRPHPLALEGWGDLDHVPVDIIDIDIVDIIDIRVVIDIIRTSRGCGS